VKMGVAWKIGRRCRAVILLSALKTSLYGTFGS